MVFTINSKKYRISIEAVATVFFETHNKDNE